ncbi:hypothetical protein GCM10009613_58550 [Pseudonocardia kongjuensis]|uniref:Uncharacterized protein n=1 Tax=Pseudonocardia kongjuensis TaxID=102227 RepID=A0ABN1YAP4_9PSEU
MQRRLPHHLGRARPAPTARLTDRLRSPALVIPCGTGPRHDPGVGSRYSTGRYVASSCGVTFRR